ncbi:MAG: outer membrane beta-barrel protein [Flavisolibacter sp.]
MIAFIFFSSHPTIAQVKDSINIGRAKGIVQDSAYNFVLSSATVAVYKDSDSSLVGYSLPNNFGEFTVNTLPVETKLRLIITHVGYKAFFKRFTIAKTDSLYNFDKINMLRRADDDTLSEVMVTAAAPMRINGDTLEFNAGAFKLDKNATTEDLLRKLPGFTIWGDGDITFNGRKINSLLVEGKPFMGGDFSATTQNLPKDAIKKVQVYQQINADNPLDSTTNVNLKLKDDKKMGYFGKVSGGYGSNDRYAADAMISGFNKKQQLNIVGAINNINKVAGNANSLIKSSSYKGEGTSIDYQPNFRSNGLNRPISAGLTYQYDFVPNPQFRNTQRFNADYFINRNNTEIQRSTATQSFLQKDSILTQLANSNNINTNTLQRLNARFQKNTEKTDFDVSGSLSLSNNQSFSETTSQQERTGYGVISTNESRNEGNSRSNNYGLNLSLRKREVDGNRIRKRTFNVWYSVNFIDNKGSSNKTTKFRSLVDPVKNMDYNRFYQNQDRFSINNNLTLEYPDLKSLIFGKKRFGDINISFKNEVSLQDNDYNDKVLDYDTASKQQTFNHYLTNDRDLNTLDIKPSLNFTKTFWRHLSNRYGKYVSINASAREAYYTMKHRSTQSFQNFDRSYKNFIPSASVNFNNNQYGRFNINHSLTYSTNVNYPQVNHIAPLVDSSNVLYIPKGNPNILPEYAQRLSYNFSFNSQQQKNPAIINFSINVGKTDDKIADSSFYDGLGRHIAYSINVDGFRFIGIDLNYRKSLEINKKNNIQVELNNSYNGSRTPNYVNNILNVSGNRSFSSKLGLDYSYRDVFLLSLDEQLNLSRSAQKGFNNSMFNSKTWSTGISGALQLPKNITWSSNVSYNRSSLNEQAPVKFTLWNANLSYRFLKGNRGEVKFSALDLLHQNKSIINIASGNSQTFGYVNVLQQYYMLTLSYFPRKFGR